MTTQAMRFAFCCGASAALAAGPALRAAVQSEIPAGTRFMVELRDKLEARKVKRGKSFEARTVEALRAADGYVVPPGAKLKGKVSYVDGNRMALRFEQIEAAKGKTPIVATTLGVVGERGVRAEAGEEGEIRASGSRGESAAIGAAIGAGLGAALGSRSGGKEAAIGAGTGAAAGAALGVAAGGRDLVLDKGSRIDLRLDRPLLFKR